MPDSLVTPWTVALQAPLSMDSPGKHTGMGCHFLLQWSFLSQGSNPGLQHYRQILYHLSHQGSPLECYSALKKNELSHYRETWEKFKC